MKKIELTREEKKNILERFYESFENGYKFEEFLKPFLKELGLDEVHVTRRSRDDGVDLEGIRYGVVANDDDVLYKVQAKRYNPNSLIGVEFVDRHLGIMNNGDKGIIITTGKFSQSALQAAKRKPETPIVLIDGNQLIDLCIEKNIGFVYKPVFSSVELNDFYNEDVKEENQTLPINYNNLSIEKDITSNDIRARILRIPRAILELLPSDSETFDLCFNGDLIKDVKISADKRYFSKGISKIYQKYGLLTIDNVFNASKSIWSYDGNKIIVNLINE